MASKTKTLPEMRYWIVDSDPPALQKTELLHIKGNWHYWRCPKSGLEWHTNGDRPLSADNPWQAWWCYIYLTSLELKFLHDDADCFHRKHELNQAFLAKFDDWTLRVARCARQFRFATKVYRAALADSLHHGKPHVENDG